MIRLYRATPDSSADQIEAALVETCLAHEVVTLPPGERPANVKRDAPLPILLDDGTPYAGAAEITAHLEELVALRERWYKYGSDACFCDDEGNIE